MSLYLLATLLGMACQPSGQGADQGQGTGGPSNAASATGPKRITVALVTAPTVLSSQVRPLGVGVAGTAELERLVLAGT